MKGRRDVAFSDSEFESLGEPAPESIVENVEFVLGITLYMIIKYNFILRTLLKVSQSLATHHITSHRLSYTRSSNTPPRALIASHPRDLASSVVAQEST